VSSTSFQVIDGGRLKPSIRKSVHTQLADLCHGVREVARRNGLTDNAVVQIAIEEERRLAAVRAELAFRAGRRSILSPMPPTAARRAA
jgi:hypothetical protein